MMMDWLFLFGLTLVAFGGFGLYFLRSIHLAILEGHANER